MAVLLPTSAACIACSRHFLIGTGLGVCGRPRGARCCLPRRVMDNEEKNGEQCTAYDFCSLFFIFGAALIVAVVVILLIVLARGGRRRISSMARWRLRMSKSGTDDRLAAMAQPPWANRHSYDGWPAAWHAYCLFGHFFAPRCYRHLARHCIYQPTMAAGPGHSTCHSFTCT